MRNPVNSHALLLRCICNMSGDMQVGNSSRRLRSLRSRRKMMHPHIVTATSINQQHLQGMALRADLGLVPLKAPLDESPPACLRTQRPERGFRGWASARGASAGLLEAFVVLSCLLLPIANSMDHRVGGRDLPTRGFHLR